MQKKRQADGGEATSLSLSWSVYIVCLRLSGVELSFVECALHVYA
jgi:hypothetical protein